MKRISLTKGKYALVDDADYEWLNQFKWCAKTTPYTTYAIRYVGGWKNQKCVWMHRMIMDAPEGMDIDHRNRNGLANWSDNLRIATRSQNNQNSLSQNMCTSKFKGVSWFRRDKKWRAYIVVKRRQIHLGYFESEHKAAKAYNKAAKELFGEFARLNVISLEVGEAEVAERNVA